MSRRGRGRENGMQQCLMKRGVKETRNAVKRYKMNNQENVDLDNNMAAHSIRMVMLLSITLIAIRVIINNNLYYVQTCSWEYNQRNRQK